MLPNKPFYMIRHGQTEANAARIMAGSMDSPLTDIGRQQAYDVQNVISALKIKPSAIFHSHLSRARDTATIINEVLNVELFEDADLAELHAGILEGAPYDECQELFTTWPDIPEGETAEEFFERVKRGKAKAINAYPDPILIVCHGGVMRAFGEIHGVDTPGRFENAHLYGFFPNDNKTHFPWDVFDYRFCEETQSLKKSPSEIYEASLTEAIAS
ncbi:MAG: histidine phosphatase family protein [Alphaproteobacteria bacterium]|nr:histidine phosphatase family protein [Alphaproteobacteria bacterium]